MTPDLLLIMSLVAAAAALAAAVSWLVFRSSIRLTRSQLDERTVALAQTMTLLDEERGVRQALDRDLHGERAARTEEKKATDEKLALLRDAQAQFLKEMDAMSRQALDRNSKSFVELARSQFETLLGKADERGKLRRSEIEKLVEPLGKSLADVRSHLREVEKSRTEAYASLTEQVKGLSTAQALLQKEAGNLVSALRKPEVRGRWGEVQLRRVVEMAGMEGFCDFEEQHSVRTADGILRPDLLVRLPAGRLIVVDAKVSLEAYLDAVAADDEDIRKAAMQRHVSQIREHVRKLGAKAYFDQFDPTPDMVIMFLPGESFYYAALQEDATLLEYGVGNNVVIATPMTLIALLRAVAYGWKQEAMADNARHIADLGKQLYDRMAVLADHFGRVGSGLNTAVDNYNKAVGSFEGRVLVQTRRFKEMGASSSKEISEVSPVDKTARSIDVPELRTPLSLVDGSVPALPAAKPDESPEKAKDEVAP